LDQRIRTQRAMLSDAWFSPFCLAHGGFRSERIIREGRGREFLGGRFLDPSETRDRFDIESISYLDHLIESYFKHPIHAMRWPDVRSALKKRAEIHARPVLEEWAHTIRAALTKVLSEHLPNLLAEVNEDLSTFPVHPEQSIDEMSGFLQAQQSELVRRLKGPLDTAITEDLLGPYFHRSVSMAGKEPAEISLEALLEGGPGLGPGGDLEGFGDDPLSQMYAEELIKAARLSPGEREALEAKLNGVPFTELACTRGVSESTISSLFLRARRKIEAAMKRS